MQGPIVFLLPGGGSGGAHSVAQEVAAINRLGFPALIVAPRHSAAVLRAEYADLSLSEATIREADGPDELRAILDDEGVRWLIATANQSVDLMVEATARSDVRRGYYVQDYEPLFYPPDTEPWVRARRSYEVGGTTLFAKTAWLQEIIRANHGVDVAKVAASVDHDIYFPRFQRDGRQRETVSAMVRPSTSRRAPHRTAHVLNWIAERTSLQVCAFGAGDEELAHHSIRLHPRIENRGVISRKAVGELFRESKLFLDLSDYQAFGRSAIEAMSCGAIVVLPSLGGTNEFAISGVNSIAVDTRRGGAVMRAVEAALGMTEAEEEEMRWRAIHAGYRFSPQGAALSIMDVLREAAGRR